MKRTVFLAHIFAVLLVGNSYAQKTTDRSVKDKVIIGKQLPAWKEGNLDIHAINTGRGESTLLIFPDGTTMLIDASGSLISATDSIPPPPQKPNDAVSPGTAIANYAKHFIKPASNRLNYMMISHFHADHMGGYDDTLPMHSSNSFRLSGITEVGAKIKVDQILDRGYPTYDYPKSLMSDTKMVNYIKFIDWAKANYHLTAEKFAVGKNDQIVLKQNPGKYANFSVRNVLGNGEVWDGKGNGSVNMLPSKKELIAGSYPENILSIGFVLAYGKFNYFTAGDLQFNDSDKHAWKDMEAPLAKVVSPVEVMKANHHGTSQTNGDALLTKLKPQVLLSHTWRDVQPNPATMARVYAANSDSQIFTTNMSDANKVRLGGLIDKMKNLSGHIVVRVQPGGDQYSVYVLDDNNEAYIVTKVFGPYKSN